MTHQTPLAHNPLNFKNKEDKITQLAQPLIHCNDPIISYICTITPKGLVKGGFETH